MEDLWHIMRMLGPYVIPALTMVGLLTVVGRWPRIKQFFFGTAMEDLAGKIPGRRKNDYLLEKLIQQNNDVMAQFMVAYKENSSNLAGAMHALRAIAGEVQDVNKKQAEMDSQSRTDFRGVHQRLDTVIERLPA